VRTDTVKILNGKAEPFCHVLRQSRGLERKRLACNPKVSGTSAASGTLALQSDHADANEFREQPPATAGGSDFGRKGE